MSGADSLDHIQCVFIAPENFDEVIEFSRKVFLNVKIGIYHSSTVHSPLLLFSHKGRTLVPLDEPEGLSWT